MIAECQRKRKAWSRGLTCPQHEQKDGRCRRGCRESAEASSPAPRRRRGPRPTSSESIVPPAVPLAIISTFREFVPGFTARLGRLRAATGSGVDYSHSRLHPSPHRGGVRLRDAGDRGDALEAIAAVQGPVAFVGGFQVRGKALGVDLLEPRLEERRPHPDSARLSADADLRQVPVRFGRAVASERGLHSDRVTKPTPAERPDETRQLAGLGEERGMSARLLPDGGPAKRAVGVASG
jgi:hypothetical protein